MNASVLLYLLLAQALSGVGCTSTEILVNATESASTTEAAESETTAEAESVPDNEWGPHYTLPNDVAQMKDYFRQAYEQYQSDPGKQTECKPNDADFERWFRNSQDATVYLLSYYCKTKVSRGYEHLKVRVLPSMKVLEFQSTLQGFGIMDAGDYSSEITDEAAAAIQSDMLERVRDQVAVQKSSLTTEEDEELCPDAGTNTLAYVATKEENGLFYTRFPISCNHTGEGFDHMTYIEVAEDRELEKLNGGEPILVGMEIPEENIAFKRELESELTEEKVVAYSALCVPTIISSCLPFLLRSLY